MLLIIPTLRAGLLRVCLFEAINRSPLISGIHIPAGSASGIHTPPLPWHPFQKGTLPPCRLHPHTASIARDRRTSTASPLFYRGTAKPGGMYPESNTKSPYKRNPHSCWLRQWYTYPATVVAPLSNADAAAVPLVYKRNKKKRHCKLLPAMSPRYSIN